MESLLWDMIVYRIDGVCLRGVFAVLNSKLIKGWNHILRIKDFRSHGTLTTHLDNGDMIWYPSYWMLLERLHLLKGV